MQMKTLTWAAICLSIFAIGSYADDKTQQNAPRATSN